MRCLAWTFLLLAGCSSTPEDVATTGGGGAPTGAGSTTTSSGAVPRTFQLSVMAESEAGSAPALLRLANDTVDQRLAITLGDGVPFAFYDVPWQTTTEYVPAAILNPVAEVIVSVCTIEACIRLRLDEIGGVQALEPVEAYTLHLTQPDGFDAEIVQDPSPEPFMGVRPRVNDSSANALGTGTHLDLALSGQLFEFEQVFSGSLERYQLAPPLDDAELEELTYIDGEGTIHTLAETISLPMVPGYTVVVAPNAVDGAFVTVPLVRQP